ncbi:hypothetical protein J7T55_001877 [Diaporthe amygdali]|uniref:uncharacterized protein n=1 Tax=Phomopsis amygdali TaxID=1214568 RepID=UPI0022FF2E76|nr:uncharacterized protein J7T55_001877 [Diaporthe amygdali]KAJ0117678.1 hypothetical protein J7T55_001877 [Diaporthe amygdali]
MAESRENEKTELKGLRRASFARALHVPAIGRRKHVEIVENANRNASPSGKIMEKVSQRTPSPNPVTVSIAPRGTEHNDSEEGAEIPDIPLRRSHVKRVSADYSGSPLTTLERMLNTGGTPDVSNNHAFGPMNPNSMMSSGERSLSDVPEASSASTIRPEADSYLESVRETHSAPESTIGSAISPYPRSAQDRSTIEPSITSVSLHTDFSSPLPALQTRGADELCDALEPLAEEDVEPGSFDLVIPATNLTVYNLERRSELLFSVDHLRLIFGDPIFLQRFLNFISIYRPQSLPLLRYYLEALKAIRALEWVNSVISGTLRLDGYDFALKGPLEPTTNKSLLQKAEDACERLARDELPAYITHVWTEFVETSMRRRITGTLPAHLHDMSDGLAEVFCITDPSRPDNPIVFTSEEFHRMTQYGLDYVIGRNCRFLQGPKTNPFAVQRIREKLDQGKQHYETFLNYRRDGSPFMNLLMCAPLMDSTGVVRYFLGAQVDVSGLAKDCSGLESLRRLVDRDGGDKQGSGTQDIDGDAVSRVDSGADVDSTAPANIPLPPRDAEFAEEDRFRLLCEIFNRQELETVRRYGGRMHRSQQEQIQHESTSNWSKGRVIIHDNETSPPSTPRRQNNSEVHDYTGNITISPRATSPPLSVAPIPSIPAVPTTLHGPRVPTIYEHFLVVRPYPSLKILFASPSLRVPGILQSHLMSRIGGSKRIHEELEQAFALGQGVTAKVRWVSGSVRSDSSSGSSSIENGGKEGRPRWIHCTPLIGSNGSVGVWMVVVVDEDADGGGGRLRRDAPSVNGPRARGDRRKNHDSLLALDTMSLNDFAAMNSLPQDEDLRQHVRHMYEETRRRERLAGMDSWDKKWPESRDGDRETIRVKEGTITSSGSWRGRVEELRKVYNRSRSSSPFTLKVDD